MASKSSRQQPKQGHRQRTGKATALKFSGLFLPNTLQKRYGKDCGCGSTLLHATPTFRNCSKTYGAPCIWGRFSHGELCRLIPIVIFSCCNNFTIKSIHFLQFTYYIGMFLELFLFIWFLIVPKFSRSKFFSNGHHIYLRKVNAFMQHVRQHFASQHPFRKK